MCFPGQRDEYEIFESGSIGFGFRRELGSDGSSVGSCTVGEEITDHIHLWLPGAWMKFKFVERQRWRRIRSIGFDRQRLTQRKSQL